MSAHERPSTHEPAGDLLWRSCELDERLGAGHVGGGIARFSPKGRRYVRQGKKRATEKVGYRPTGGKDA